MVKAMRKIKLVMVWEVMLEDSVSWMKEGNWRGNWGLDLWLSGTVRKNKGVAENKAL